MEACGNRKGSRPRVSCVRCMAFHSVRTQLRPTLLVQWESLRNGSGQSGKDEWTEMPSLSFDTWTPPGQRGSSVCQGGDTEGNFDLGTGGHPSLPQSLGAEWTALGQGQMLWETGSKNHQRGSLEAERSWSLGFFVAPSMEDFLCGSIFCQITMDVMRSLDLSVFVFFIFL